MTKTKVRLQKKFKPINRGIHLAMGRVLKSFGFTFHQKKSGDCTIGYWVIKFRQKNKQLKIGSRRFVLVPGLGDTPLSWLPALTLLIPVIRSRYDELILLDFPGFFGFLNHVPPIPSMDLLIQNFGDLMDSLKPHTIMGHSLGGWLTATYCAEIGAQTRPRAKGKRATHKGPELIFLAVPSGVFSSQKDKFEWRDKFHGALDHGFDNFRANMFHKEPKLFGLVAGEFGDFFDRPEIREFIHSIRDEHLIIDRLEHIESRVWLIWAENDKVAPLKWVRPWMKGLMKRPHKKVEAVVIKNTGHSLQIESPVALSTIVGHVLLNREPPNFGKKWWTRL